MERDAPQGPSLIPARPSHSSLCFWPDAIVSERRHGAGGGREDEGDGRKEATTCKGKEEAAARHEAGGEREEEGSGRALLTGEEESEDESVGDEGSLALVGNM
jgi:hypothetical protein